MRNHKVLAKCVTNDCGIIISRKSVLFEVLMYPKLLHYINYLKDAKKLCMCYCACSISFF